MADIVSWLEGLTSADVVRRGEAAEELAKLGEAAQAAAVPLVKLAADDDETVREWVVAALESLGTPSVDDIAPLQELIFADDADVAYWAITLLGRLETQAAPVVPQLTKALESNPHPHNRQRAAWALGKIGASAKAALPALQVAAHDTDARLARIAQLAIEQISAASA